MEAKKIAYDSLAEKSNVSRTYLTRYQFMDLIPSKEIIEKISDAISINPSCFKIYRVMKIIENLEKLYWFLSYDNVLELEDFF